MAQYVKIRKSKNLRFKLISLMYLIFLIMSVIQIPISWLSVTQKMHPYLRSSSAVISDSLPSRVAGIIAETDDHFMVALGADPKTGIFPEANSYAITDAFFIEGDAGKVLFNAMAELKDWALTLPASDERRVNYERFFAEDLEHGLGKDKMNSWITYRWKHVPAGLARNMLEEIRLRIKLLSAPSVEDKGVQEQMEEPAFSLMTGYSYLRVGDVATLSTRGDSLQEVLLERDGRRSSDYSINEETIQFRPTVAGLYRMLVKGKVKSETMTIRVLPAGFPKKEALPFRICYVGIDYEQPLGIREPALNIKCSSDPGARYMNETGVLRFTPHKEGWCTLQISNAEGILFHDSVFVKPMPAPMVRVKGCPENAISRKRLMQTNSLELMAWHPSFREEAYAVSSFHLRKVGRSTTEETLPGSNISLTAQDVADCQYLIVYDIAVKAGMETKKIDQPIIIQIH